MNALITALSSILAAVGILGTIVPGLPGLSLVTLATVTYALLTDYAIVGGDVVTVAVLLMVLGYLIRWLLMGTRPGEPAPVILGAALFGAGLGLYAGGVRGLFVGAALAATAAETVALRIRRWQYYRRRIHWLHRTLAATVSLGLAVAVGSLFALNAL